MAKDNEKNKDRKDKKSTPKLSSPGATGKAEVVIRGAATYEEAEALIQEAFIENSIREYFEALLIRHNISSSEAVNNADMDRDFGRQVLTGKRKTRPDNYIRLAIGMGLSFDETQSMLKFLCAGPIYALRKRDAAIMYCIQEGYDMMNTQLFLDEHGFEPLGDKAEDVVPGPEAGEPPPSGGGEQRKLSTMEAEAVVRESQSYDDISEAIDDRRVTLSTKAYFDELLEKSELTAAKALRAADIPASFGFQLLNGLRKAKKRDTYIRLGVVMGLSYDEIQSMLKFLQTGIIYALKKRDSVIMHCLLQSYTLEQIQVSLAERGFEPL